MVNHFDDIFQAETAAKVDRLVNRGSLVLAGVSLLFLVFTLPSFWLDTWQFADVSELAPAEVVGRGHQPLLRIISWFGNSLAAITVLVVVGMIVGLIIIPLHKRRREQRGNRPADRSGTRGNTYSV